MNRIGAILMTVAVVGALLAVPLGVSAAAADHNESTTGANSAVAPGERLAGAVGVQQATVDGDLSNRTYEVRLQNAESDEQRADIIAERRDEIEQRLTEHRAELAELRAARDAGNISEGTYRARVATVAAEKTSTERSAKQAGATARQLPDSVLAERGVSVESLDELRTNASELGGEETAEIARDIGGRNVSGAATGDRPKGAPNERPSGDQRAGDTRLGDGASGVTEETVPTGNPNGNQADTETGSPSDDQSSNAERDTKRNTQQNGANGDTDNRSNNEQSP
jgi:ribosomal protein L29